MDSLPSVACTLSGGPRFLRAEVEGAATGEGSGMGVRTRLPLHALQI
jgi:hypothetical protein